VLYAAWSKSYKLRFGASFIIFYFHTAMIPEFSIGVNRVPEIEPVRRRLVSFASKYLPTGNIFLSARSLCIGKVTACTRCGNWLHCPQRMPS